MATYCLTLQYDGTRYNGWQKQGNTPNTIQEKLETLLSRLYETPVEIAGSGRTDAGVHALAQTASFHIDRQAGSLFCGRTPQTTEPISAGGYPGSGLPEKKRAFSRPPACQK